MKEEATAPQLRNAQPGRGRAASQLSLACFLLAAILAVKAGGYDQSWWVSQLQLIIGWRVSAPEGGWWYIARASYVLAILQGIGGFVWAEKKSRLIAWIPFALSALAFALAIGGALLVPRLAKAG